MKNDELKFFTEKELSFYDATSLPVAYLLKCMFVKLRRKLSFMNKRGDNRFVWTATAVSDATGPTDNVRNYFERKNIRSILAEISKEYRIKSACDIGCGYGRLTMVLGEFAQKVVGFEREPHLVSIARSLLPEQEFLQVDSLNLIDQREEDRFDLAMTCTVLQHMTDDSCRNILDIIKRIADPYILIIEKTESVSTTENVLDGDEFMSTARPVSLYEEWLKPFRLIMKRERILEATYFNKSPGTCMLFKR